MVVDSIEGSTEVERDKGSRFVIVGRIVNMIESTHKGCFSGVIAAVSRLIRVDIGRCKNVELKA